MTRPRTHRIAIILAVAVLSGLSVGTLACGDSPTEPTDPALQITCPASKTIESSTGNPIAIDFGTPTTTGGTAPVTITCTPASGSNFPAGATTVTCTAHDAKQHAASCGLTVTVTKIGTLSATRFMGFGDSITFGVIPTSCPDGSPGSLTSAQIMRDLQTVWPRATPPPSTAYPNVLRTLLAGRYVPQSPTLVVFNEGVPGERITDDSWGTNDVTLNRLRSALTTDVPQVLLLVEGVNDLNSNSLHPEVVIPAVIKALRDMIREAKLRGVGVLLGTLLPQQAGACRAYAPALIAPTNDQIRALAVSDGAVLVDLNQAFGTASGQYMSLDGLHPNALGYDKMAQTFFDSIRTTFEK